LIVSVGSYSVSVGQLNVSGEEMRFPSAGEADAGENGTKRTTPGTEASGDSLGYELEEHKPLGKRAEERASVIWHGSS
jgi:hypothetical protein